MERRRGEMGTTLAVVTGYREGGAVPREGWGVTHRHRRWTGCGQQPLPLTREELRGGVRGSARWPIGGRERTTTVVLLVSTEAKRQREPSPPRTKRSGCLLGHVYVRRAERPGAAPSNAQRQKKSREAEEVQERKKPRGANGRQHIVPRRIHGRAPTGGGLERERQSSNALHTPAQFRRGLTHHARPSRPDAWIPFSGTSCPNMHCSNCSATARALREELTDTTPWSNTPCPQDSRPALRGCP
jgi:hypothetical protein